MELDTVVHPTLVLTRVCGGGGVWDLLWTHRAEPFEVGTLLFLHFRAEERTRAGQRASL